MYRYYNPNPRNRIGVGDCTVRAISKALDVSWNVAYVDLVIQGYLLADMPSSNMVMRAYLRSQGFSEHALSNSCPDCYTISQFADDNPKGTFIVGTGTHVVAVVDGVFYDSWNSGDETPIYYYQKEND